jgi:hypothetical protein
MLRRTLDVVYRFADSPKTFLSALVAARAFLLVRPPAYTTSGHPPFLPPGSRVPASSSSLVRGLQSQIRASEAMWRAVCVYRKAVDAERLPFRVF